MCQGKEHGPKRKSSIKKGVKGFYNNSKGWVKQLRMIMLEINKEEFFLGRKMEEKKRGGRDKGDERKRRQRGKK